MMRTPLLLVVLVVALACPAAAQRQVDVRRPVAPGVALPIRVHNMAGSVTVIGWDRDSVVVTGAVHETTRERFFVSVEKQGAKLGFWDSDAQAVKPSHMEVRVPARSHVWVKTASADISVAGVTGSVDASSVSGNVLVSGTPREVTAESMGGTLDIRADTRLARARTASGAIRMRGRIRDATAITVSGSVTVSGGGIERGRFESVDGDIRYAGAVPAAGTLDFANHSGGVELLLPSSTSGDFVVSTFEGSLMQDFGVRLHSSGSTLTGREQSFTLGDGGAEVLVRSFKGRVAIRRDDG